MTRFGKIRPRSGHFDLEQAFQFLGMGATLPELGVAADLLNQAEIEVVYNDDLVALAIANGSSALCALDLATVAAHGLESLTSGGGASR